jgi:polyisoprenoid-binding protein YceI
MKKTQSLLLGMVMLALTPLANAADYTMDTKGMHAFINFRVQHLGYSWLYGGFKDFSGEFSYDKNAPARSKASVVIKTESLDTNHAERNKHLRSADFFNVDKYPEIKFVSSKYTPKDANSGTLVGNLTMHGVTKPVTINIDKIGEGKDPWGGYRSGFYGTTEINRSDFGIDKNLGPASEKVEITLSIEGVKK